MMNLISETNYAEAMKHTVLPYLAERKTSGDFERIAGEPIHYRIYKADTPRADLVLVHGFTEGIDKFNETVYYFLQAGLNVWQIQQRGHGKSFRAVSDPSLVYIENYMDLVEDLHFFVTEIVDQKRHDPSLPKYLFGHSMGGGVSAIYLETYPKDFSKAVLSSPMLELDSGNVPVWVATLYARGKILRGKGTDYMPGSAPYSPEPDFENSNSNSRERYAYWFEQTLVRPEYRTCVSAVGTALSFLKITRAAVKPKNCARITADVLLIQAGKDTVVKPGGQEAFISRIGKRGRLFRMENAKHEIYLCSDEDLVVYWQEILDFLR